MDKDEAQKVMMSHYAGFEGDKGKIRRARIVLGIEDPNQNALIGQSVKFENNEINSVGYSEKEDA